MTNPNLEHGVTGHPRIIAFATQGENSGDAERIKTLLSGLNPEMYLFQREGKIRQFVLLLKFLQSERPNLAVMEGTGIAGGFALILARLLWGVRYVVSSGDAVGPFVRMFHPVIGIAFEVYERILCRLADGYIGWTPYLTGRALTFGCRRAMTAPGWAPVQKSDEELLGARKLVRAQLGIPDESIVFGIVGSLAWNHRVGFCYGLELIQALQRVSRRDVCVLIVGDGEGKEHLMESADGERDERVFFTGHVPRDEVPNYLAAMDVASLPQSLDGVGSFRYTTKISEYLAAKLPIVTGQLPMTYDLPSERFWRLDGATPWGEGYVSGLAAFMNGVSTDELHAKQDQLTLTERLFSRDTQVHNVRTFITSLMQDAEAFTRYIPVGQNGASYAEDRMPMTTSKFDQ